MLANHGRVLASTTPLEPGFATWLQQFRQEQSARGDLARLAADEEWEDGQGFAFYFLRIPRAAERALKSAWQRYVAELRRQGQAVSHASGLAFTTADLRGRPRQHVAGYIAEKVQRAVQPCPLATEELSACPACKQEWHGRVFEIVACCAERGYSDAQIVYLVRASSVAVELWGMASVARYRQTTYYIRKLRRQHPHPGRTCESARCPSTPEWMARYARVG